MESNLFYDVLCVILFYRRCIWLFSLLSYTVLVKANVGGRTSGARQFRGV